ncbi:MAG: hypothetical protein ACK480_06885, partial [Planctomycetota bacterium]
SVLRHRVSPYDVEFTQTHIPVKTSIQTGFETASRRSGYSGVFVGDSECILLNEPTTGFMPVEA